MNPIRPLFATAALLLAMPLAALAQAGGPPDGPPPGEGEPHHRGPPPEAIAACKAKAVGAQASFTDRAGHTVSGACTQMGDVVAVPPPAHPHGDRNGGAPSQPGQ
jgi:hypothetical protein